MISKEDREKDYQYIKKFSKIKVTSICRKFKIDRQNVLNNKTTAENIRKVKEAIEEEIARLYIKELNNGK